MKLNAYGRHISIVYANDRWEVFDLGNDGKKRRARDIAIPACVAEADLAGYVSDLLHEYANARNPEVVIIG
jgi:hypothetical protein